jgi:hypothetical protein
MIALIITILLNLSIVLNPAATNTQKDKHDKDKNTTDTATSQGGVGQWDNAGN